MEISSCRIIHYHKWYDVNVQMRDEMTISIVLIYLFLKIVGKWTNPCCILCSRSSLINSTCVKIWVFKGIVTSNTANFLFQSKPHFRSKHSIFDLSTLLFLLHSALNPLKRIYPTTNTSQYSHTYFIKSFTSCFLLWIKYASTSFWVGTGCSATLVLFCSTWSVSTCIDSSSTWSGTLDNLAINSCSSWLSYSNNVLSSSSLYP